MRGKEYLDKKYGEVRGNGNGMAAILEDYSKENIKNALSILPRHKVLIEGKHEKAVNVEIETVELSTLLILLDIEEDAL